MLLALKGFLAGALCGLPLGPAGVLCLHRTLQQGRRAGWLAALGIAAAHALWCLAVAGWIGNAEAWIASYRRWAQAGFGAVVCAYGWRVWRQGRRTTVATAAPSGPSPGFAPILTLAAGNPATLLTLGAAFWVVGFEPRALSPGEVIGLSCAVFLGAASLWLVLVGFLGRLAVGPGSPMLQRLRCGVGALLLALGTLNLVSSLTG